MTLKGKDINKLPTDGYVIFPLSMSRLQGDQSPEKCMEYMAVLDDKINIPGNDVVFLYTNGLYFNTKEFAYTVRKRTTQQMLAHRNALKRLILKKGTYMPGAFHFLPFDYIILNSDCFQPFFEALYKLYKKNKDFKKYLLEALGEREPCQANIDFMLEEIAVGHIIREHLIDFPKTLVKKDKFRLIVYPGPVFKPEIYIWQKRLLPQESPKKLGRYYNATYDPKKRVLYRFDEVKLD
ncbi:hypothetical protein AYK26_02600 [Euryarchaeota archaeon SM23-78]|nr:MAG: hypothetical protein AYK26_02600 [Euryarchaeota archaeon SM23-78]MBW3000261.1 hypothetical protein [Candidatus Woesearchaeota archaeon]